VPTAPDLGTACASCGARIGPSLLACPACLRLVHAERLQELARRAEEASAAGDPSAALAAWREARDLLPPGSRQRIVVDQKVAALSTAVDRGARPARPRTAWGWIVAAAALVASKAKLLLVGLTKASTLLSMILAMGLYWAVWGWRFAAGFVASIFVHEMGHVAALQRFGIRATAPMFLPGVGAVVRFRQDMAPAEEARVGLAGPLWGFGAAVVALGVAYGTGSPLWAAIAHAGAWVNLFNLLPIVPLDGGRGFRALDRGQRLATLPVLAAAWYATGEGLVALLLIVALIRALEATSGARDVRSWVEYAGLVAGLTLVGAAAAPLARVAGR
jgi:Zn-dependent protease